MTFQCLREGLREGYKQASMLEGRLQAIQKHFEVYPKETDYMEDGAVGTLREHDLIIALYAWINKGKELLEGLASNKKEGKKQ